MKEGVDMARSAQPADLHILQGNPNNRTKKELYSRKKHEDQLTVGKDKINPPEWLDPTARSIFNQVKEIIITTGLITNADVDLIAMYSITVADLKNAELKILEIGRYADSPDGSLKVNSLMKEKRKIIDQMLKLQNELALTPRARASLAIAMSANEEDESDDEFD